MAQIRAEISWVPVLVPLFSGKPKLRCQAGSGKGTAGLAGSGSKRWGLPNGIFLLNFRHSLGFPGPSVAGPYQPLLFPVLISVAFSQRSRQSWLCSSFRSISSLLPVFSRWFFFSSVISYVCRKWLGMLRSERWPLSMFWKVCLPASSKMKRKEMLRNFDLGFIEFRFIVAASVIFLNNKAT